MKSSDRITKKARSIYAMMSYAEKKVFRRDCQCGFGHVCESMTCNECIEKKAYIGQEEKEQSACTQD